MKVKEKSKKAGLKLNILKTKAVASSPNPSWQKMGKRWKQWQTLYSWAPKITEVCDFSHEIKRHLLLGRKTMTNLDRILEKQRHYFAHKSLYSQRYGFSNSHVWIWDLDNNKGWALKNWCFWTVILEETLKSPLDFKKFKAVNPEGNQPWVFTGRSDAEAEAPLLWPPDARNWLLRKDPDAGKDWRQGGERDDRGRDGWMTSPTQWTWVWVSSGKWWMTGKSGVLQSMGSQRVGHDWTNEQQWQRTLIDISHVEILSDY